jgi:serine/threonine protein kinase
LLTAQNINNRYQQINRIGSGSMGAVFQTKDRLLGQDVALKYVVATEEMDLYEETQPTDYRLALVQEFKILSSLRHPNIISVLDYGFDHYQQPFFTMDYLSRAKTIIQAAENSPLEEKVGLLIQLLQAISYLHRRNIIHRDLKPDNVLVKDNQVKVLDFGLAVARELISEEFGGTVSYAAPETLSGQPPSRASDLYSVGCIAYEILRGRFQ